MKILLLALMLIPTLSIAQDYTRTYNGEIFAAENAVVCETEFRRITNLLEGIEGYAILDGNCMAINEKKVQLKFNYIAPLTKNLERFRYEFTSRAACELQAKLGALAVSASKNLFVASFCQGRRYVMDYIDRSYSVMRDLKMKAYFTDLKSCSTEVKRVTKALEANNMAPVIKYCRPFKSVSADQTFYSLVMIYSSNYKKEMRAIPGRLVDGVCFDQQVNVERTFSEAGVDIAHKFCSQGSQYSSAREFILYIDDTQLYDKKVKLYKGSNYRTEAECTIQMNDIMAKFKGIKRDTVYNYCVKLRENMYQLNIHYVQKK